MRRGLVRPRQLMSSYFHTSASLFRGAKHLDWYHREVEKVERAAPPPYPVDSLHGRARARAFMDFSFDSPGEGTSSNEQPNVQNPNLSRVIFELADDIVPVTVGNFLSLCARPPQEGYVGSHIFRVQRGFAVFGGDWKEGTGRGGHSSFPARYFPDENFICRHTVPGVIAMASSGVHSNSSNFYITLAPAPHLDARCVVFGRVLLGMDVVTKISNAMHVDLKPSPLVEIRAAGRIEAGSKEWEKVDKEIAAAKKIADADSAKVSKAAAAKIVGGDVKVKGKQ